MMEGQRTVLNIFFTNHKDTDVYGRFTYKSTKN